MTVLHLALGGIQLLLFPDGLRMVAVVSWWTLDGCSASSEGRNGKKECKVNIADKHKNADEIQDKGIVLCMYLATHKLQMSDSYN